jgi:hypothetical protein
MRSSGYGKWVDQEAIVAKKEMVREETLNDVRNRSSSLGCPGMNGGGGWGERKSKSSSEMEKQFIFRRSEFG